ncbi:hypothetical protein ACHAQA_002726 [Verticillium albo-atrum]
MSVTTLAPELLHQCLGHLSQEDLAHTNLVCRKWLASSREHFWGNVRLTLDDENASLLAPLLGEGTAVPRKIKDICIDESDYIDDRSEDDTAKWQANVIKIMRHFSTVSALTIRCLDLSPFPVDQRSQVLLADQIYETIVIQWLKVGSAQEAASFILNQPNITFLGIGFVVLAQNDEDEDEQDGDEDENKNENNSASIVAPEPLPEQTIRLDRLRHLCLFSGSKGVAWSHLVPSLANGNYTQLRTIIAECFARDGFAKLINAASPALRSLAMDMNGPGVDMDVAKVRSLTNLSIEMAKYPGKEHVLADAVVTISSAPPSVEHIFFSIGPPMLEPERQLDSAPAQWAILNASLAKMPQLRRITVVMVLDSCISMFADMDYGLGLHIKKWKDEALEYMKGRLPACDEKGLLEVKHVNSPWNSGAFAYYPFPE